MAKLSMTVAPRLEKFARSTFELPTKTPDFEVQVDFDDC